VAIAVCCILFLTLWLFFWLFIASRDSGRTILITEVEGKQHVEVRYSNEQRYRPYIPLVVLGVYGGFVGSVVSILVWRRSWDQRFLCGFVISPMITVLSIAIICRVLAFFTPSYLQLPDLKSSQQILQALGVLLLLSPGLCIFAGFPSLLGGVATAYLLNWGRRPPVIPKPPPQDVGHPNRNDQP